MTVPTKLVDRYSETQVEDEVVVMNLASGDFFSLKDSAQAIWHLIDGLRPREAIIAALAQEYGVADGEIAGDVDHFLARLRDAGLLARG